MEKILVLISVLLMIGCVSTPTRPVAKRSQEIHYNSSGQFTGRTFIKEYKNGSITKEHYNEKGIYTGRSYSK